MDLQKYRLHDMHCTSNGMGVRALLFFLVERAVRQGEFYVYSPLGQKVVFILTLNTLFIVLL